MTAVELHVGSPLVPMRRLRVVRRAPRPGGALAAHAGGGVVAPLAAGLPWFVRWPRAARIVGAAALAALALSVAGVLGAATAATPQPGVPAAAAMERTVVVGTGQTVWDVAAVEAPSSAPAYALELLALNDLDAGAVQPGTVLALPTD